MEYGSLLGPALPQATKGNLGDRFGLVADGRDYRAAALLFGAAQPRLAW